MKRTALIFWLAGLLLLIGMVAWQGFANIGTVVARVGWGIVIMCAFQIFPLTLSAMCWRRLLPADSRQPLWAMVRMRWICGAINSQLPVAQVGGEFVRTRLLSLRGVRGADAGASVVVDMTIGIATQSLFGLLGIILLLMEIGPGDTVYAAAAGIFVFGLMITGFYLAQRFGLFFKLAHNMERIVKIGDWRKIIGGAQALDESINAVYSRQGDFFIAVCWRFLGLIVGTGHIMLALYFLGHPVSFVDALILESLGQAIRNAAFIVPGAMGVQEGGFMVLGSLMGLTPELGLALGLVVRVRNILIGLPGLFLWQAVESKLAITRSGKEPLGTASPQGEP